MDGDTPEILLSRISQTKIDFEEGNWNQISLEAKVIILKGYHLRIFKLILNNSNNSGPSEKNA